MTTLVDIVNRSLQSFGTRTTVASLSEVSNEARQANIFLVPAIEQLCRMAPWNCCTIAENLIYITSTPGTPENPNGVQTPTWVRGQPFPPWQYEYQFPVNCARPLWLLPNLNNTFGDIPIYPSGVISMPNIGSFPTTPPVPFRVAIDYVFSIASAVVLAGGVGGYAVGDSLEAVKQTDTGAPATFIVASVDGAGHVGTVTAVSQVPNASPPQAGSYFTKPTNPILLKRFGADDSTADISVTATFNAASNQRVILTNIQNPSIAQLIFVYDPNVMDPQLQEAWVSYLGGRLCYALTGDKGLANQKIGESNAIISAARTSDGNEGLTVNDVTPDWIRGRGIFDFGNSWNSFDWGPLFPLIP